MPIRLPEHRQIELYTHRRSLPIADDPDAFRREAEERARTLAGAYAGLVRLLAAGDEALDPAASWEAYRRLPRAGLRAKILAETMRALRLFHIACAHPLGRIDVRNGLIKASATIAHTGLSIRITVAGADLLESLAAYAVAAADGPYPEAYDEAMLGTLFADANAEIRWYNDEDRVLYQFAPPLRLNRHLRFDCDNARHAVAGGRLAFEVREPYRDPVRFPIDFFVHHDGRLHIVPAEALDGWGIDLGRLPAWRARLGPSGALPARFRGRFAREEMRAGLPMT